MQLVTEHGSLQLYLDDDENYWVHLRDDNNWSASLPVARDWFELSSPWGQIMKLNGSQAQTVKTWMKEYY